MKIFVKIFSFFLVSFYVEYAFCFFGIRFFDSIQPLNNAYLYKYWSTPRRVMHSAIATLDVDPIRFEPLIPVNGMNSKEKLEEKTKQWD